MPRNRPSSRELMSLAVTDPVDEEQVRRALLRMTEVAVLRGHSRDDLKNVLDALIDESMPVPAPVAVRGGQG